MTRDRLQGDKIESTPLMKKFKIKNSHLRSKAEKRLDLMMKNELIKLVLFLTLGKIIIFLTFPNIEKMATRWDSEIYQHIALYGYTSDYYYAFSPLYPILIRLLNYIIQNIWLSALIITNLLSYTCPIIVYKLFGFRTALLFELFPTYLLFTTIPYSDVISLTLLALSMLVLRKDRKSYEVLSGVTLALAIINRYILALTIIYYLYKKKYFASLIAILLAGIVIVPWYWLNLGSPFAYFTIQAKYWASGFTDPYSQAIWILTGPITNQPWSFLGFTIPPYLWLVRNIAFEAFYVYATVKLRNELKVLSLSIILPNFFLTGTASLSIPRFLLQNFVVFSYLEKVINTEIKTLIYITLSFILASIITSWQMQAFFS